MTNVRQYYQGSESPYAKAADHVGINVTARITATGVDTFMRDGEAPQDKVHITLNLGVEKPIVLSPSNADALMGQFGEESDEWIGKQILLTTKTWNIKGQLREGFIVMPIVERTEQQPDLFGDDIPH